MDCINSDSEQVQTVLADRDLRNVAERMAGPVRDACRAQAVLFSFETSDPGRRCVLSYAQDAQCSLVAALDRFCREKNGVPRAFEPGGLKPHDAGAAGQFVLVLVPLEMDGHSYGAMALAIHRRNWGAQRAFEACAQVAHLVSMNLSASLTRLKLERDLADLNRRTLLLQRQSEIDPLTGVENKASFEARARERLADTGRAAALIVIDLDFFKDVNDVFGHQFGDIYLQTIAGAMRASLPPGALIGRVGGDEFAAIIDMPGSSEAYLADLVTRLRGSVARKVALLGKSDLGQLSIGGAVFPEHAESYSDLFGHADAALYQSKNQGRNRTRLHRSGETLRPDFAPGLVCEADVFSKVTAAYQPIVDLASGVCHGVEALARLGGARAEDGSRGLGWMFRDHVLAPRLTRHILRQALSTTAGLPSAQRPKLWVNMTKFDLLDAEFVFDFEDLLDAQGLGWDHIVAEVHEGVILSDRSGRTYRTVQELRRRGASIALDDFGVGHAGLTHLRDWPVDIIKIDQSFVRDVHRDPFARVVIGALLTITGHRGIEVVAEGIENPEQADAMRALGCRFGQGFHFDAALPPDRLATRLARDGAAENGSGTAPGTSPEFEDV